MIDTQSSARNPEIMRRLQAAFGEERDHEFADLDGLGTLSLFLRPAPTDTDLETEASTTPQQSVTRQDFATLRRIRRQARQETSTSATLIPPEDHLGRVGFAALIEELPHLRENFTDWLASIDIDNVMSSSSLEELKVLQTKTAYRLRLLKTMTAETQRELDHLIIAIRAAETTHTDPTTASEPRPE